MKPKRLSKAKHAPKVKRASKVQRLSLDIITALPQTIIETILCLLPIEETARTSILSREWRYKWTTIPKLVFSHPHGGQIMETSKLLCAIHQVMSLRQDPIHEFTLYLDDGNLFSKIGYVSCELDQIILKLSRDHAVKKLTLHIDEFCRTSYDLPLSFFSLHHLTDLHLSWCSLDHQPIFNGFGSLTSLTLYCVMISMKTLLHLLSNCPALKTFTLVMIVNNFRGHEKSTMIELFECLPVIEHLTILNDIIKWFVPDLVPQELPTPQIHLKYFCLEQMSFFDVYGLTFLAVLIKNSPNLEKIELQIADGLNQGLRNEMEYNSDIEEECNSTVWLEHLSDVWLEHLTELTVDGFSNLEPELEFVKFILATSPKLKKVCIISLIEKDEKSRILKTLLRAPRTSGVEIDFV